MITFIQDDRMYFVKFEGASPYVVKGPSRSPYDKGSPSS